MQQVNTSNTVPNIVRPGFLFSLGRLVTGFLIIAWIAVFAGFIIFTFVNEPAASGEDVLASIIQIPSGLRTAEIGELLQAEGLIANANFFALLSRILGFDDQLQAGYYRIRPDMTLMQVIGQLKKGKVATFKVTIPEGMQAKEIAQLFSDRGLVDKERFYELVQDDRLVYGDKLPFDKPTHSLEGYLYPDTYIIAKGQTEESIIKRMVARFQESVVPYISENNSTRFDMHEVLTLASIVEEEAMVDRERPIIAGVFTNRLNISMPLQSCPTVQYVMETPRAKLLYEDLQIDSPYNTYKHRGLPPGPISNPGMESIRAAMNPADVNFIYFVARGNGTHVFSRTFNEHVSARRRLGI